MVRIHKCFLCLLIFSQTSLAQDIHFVKITETFEKAPLSRVLRVLKNKYDLKIAYDDALISGTTISGQFSDKSITDFLNLILLNKGIDYQLLNDKIILIPKSINLDSKTPTLFGITVFGVVQDAKTGESLPNALVSISGLGKGSVTNKDGYFSLTQVPTDTSTISVNYLGYKKETLKLEPGKAKQTLRIIMQESALDLSEFTVVDDKYNTIKYGDEISQITIDPKNLSALPSLGELDIFRSLQYLPGISGSDETSSALTIRSSPSAHNLVLFDGFTIYRLDHFFGVFSAINADAVRDIQIYKGGYGAQFGGRVSGVVDITGTTGNFNEPHYSFGVNLLSARMSSNIPFAKGRGAIHISGRRAYTDIIRSKLFENLYSNYRNKSTQVNQQAFNNGQNESDFIRPDFHFFDVNLKASYKVSNRDVMSLSFYKGEDYLDTDYDILNFGEPNNPNAIDQIDSYTENADWGNTGIGFIWSRNWNRNYYSSLQAAYSNYFFNYLYNNERRTETGDLTGLYELLRTNSVRDFQFNFRNEISLGSRHSLETGLSYSNIDVFKEANIRDLNSNGNTPDNGSPTMIGNIFSAYLSDNISLSRSLQLRIGGRFNATDVSDKNYFGQRLALIYQISPSLELKATTGKYFQLMREEVYDDPYSNNENGWSLAFDKNNPNIRALPVMESTHYIFGFQYSKNDFTFDVEYYQKQTSGLTEYNISHVYDNPLINITQGRSEIEGVDILLQKRLKKYQGWVAYTRSKARNRFEGINNNDFIPAREDQRNEVKLVNIYKLPKWNFSATWVYGSGKPFYSPTINLIRDNQNNIVNYEVINYQKTIERLPAYHRLDLSVALKFENEYIKGEIGLSILNTYNRINIHSKRLKRDEIERAINGAPNATIPSDLFRNIVLLDRTPSIFLNLNF